MAKAVLLEEFHLTVFAPRTVAAAEQTAMCRCLRSRRFHAHLRRAISGLIGRHPALGKARIVLSR